MCVYLGIVFQELLSCHITFSPVALPTARDHIINSVPFTTIYTVQTVVGKVAILTLILILVGMSKASAYIVSSRGWGTAVVARLLR